MRSLATILLIAVVLLAGMAVSSTAVAGGRTRVGVSVGVGVGWGGYWGGPYWGPRYPYYGGYWGPGYYYPPPAYYYPPAYYPPAAVVAPQAPVYIERDDPPAPSTQAAPQQGWWFYCASAKAYYPYVKECPEPWQRVAPQPPGQP